MSTTVPAPSAFETARALRLQAESTAHLPRCVDCGTTSGPWQPTGARAQDGAQLFRCSAGCPATIELDSGDTHARSATVFVEHYLADGVPLLYDRKDGALRVTYDPAQISFESARELFTESNDLYPTARAVAFTNIGRTVIADLPADELPVRIEQHGHGRCTVTFDDTRISGEQLLALMDEAAGR
ncbi:hypothetical protein [Streptomyces fulvorobeus]|uniref:Uncharacterized protein n=1 Tax=Streptomyces fulvorobeus TaxID=284028 RepID=A0A7J0C2F4_9ACTN|nr:hypothetical protein [Streptomyces fulvorobeus]NYE40410.1 hypothetical protein [Streptomyces fulvorobeus]GFM96690.1 hypothetical protein Sfulv_15010 [Streptomyces fulvorobeus]